MNARRAAAAVLLAFLFVSTLSAADTSTPVAVPYGPAEFPDWQKDLRRAEIISFGSLPFVTFFASIYYEVFRYYTHDQQEGYLPWIFKDSDTAIEMSEDEQKMIILTSAGISVGVAVVDFSWRTIRRAIINRRAERESAGVEPIRIEPILPPVSDDAELPPGTDGTGAL
jgi:hypothetical protein